MPLKRYLRPAALVGGMSAASLAAAALLGLLTSDPVIDSAAGGVLSYKSADGTVTISGTPSALLRNDPFLFGEFVGASADDEKLISIQFKVDASGRFVGGVDGPDLIVKGAIDTDFDGVADYDGILLEAEVSQFGFQDGAAGATDRFDLRLGSVTGLLAPLYAGSDLAISVDSEPSEDYPSPFGGGFGGDFMGPAKITLGSTTPLTPAACKIDVEAFCSVDGKPNRSVCRINVTKSPWHWEQAPSTHGNKTFKMYKYGMHGDPVPPWASRYPATPVKFTYVVRNTGTTPVSGLKISDGFDVDPSGYATTLQPGQSITVTRTEKLRDGMLDLVVVSGQNGAASCMDKDTVAIKDKVRWKRHHDLDSFRDKRDDGNHRR